MSSSSTPQQPELNRKRLVGGLVAFASNVRQFFSPPVFDDDERNRTASLLTSILLSVMAAGVVAIPILMVVSPVGLSYNWMLTGGALTTALVLQFFVRRGYVRAAATVLSSMLLLASTAANLTFGGIRNTVVTGYFLVIVIAALLLGGQAAIIFGLLSVSAALVVFFAEINGIIIFPMVATVHLVDWFLLSTVLILGAVLLRYAVRSIASGFEQARRNQDALLERTRELEASQRVTFAASERTTPDELLGLVVDLIRDQFNLYHVQVYIVDNERREAVLRESTGYAGRQLLQKKHKISLDSPRSLVVQAIHQRKPVLVSDVSLDEHHLPNLLLPDTRCELAVPLKIGERVIGVLDAQDRVAGRFNESTVALFQTMTDQIAFLFENSELLKRISEQTEALTRFTNQLRTAADLARQMNSILDPDQILGEVVTQLHDRFDLYHVHVYLLDQETNDLVMRAGSGRAGQVLREQDHKIPLDFEQSLVARAARTKELVSVVDTRSEPDFLRNPLLPQTRCELSIPLLVGEKVVGVLDVQDDQPGRFSQSDMDVFSTLAGQIATAVQNASLFEQVEENLAEAEARFGVSQALAGAQTEDEVLDAMIKVAGFYPKAAVSIFLLDHEADELTFVQSRAALPNDRPAVSMPYGARIPISQFPLADYISPDKTFISDNLLFDKRTDLAARQFIQMFGAVSLAHLPIKSGGEWLGIITVLSEAEGYFDEHRLYLYQSLAEQGAVALRTARLYDETQRTAARLREVDRLKSEFLASMSHELRTPLNSILGYTEIMLMGLDGELEPETLEDLQAIYDNGQHLLNLINDILDLAKIEAGRMALNIESVAVDSLLAEVKTSNAGLLVNKPIEMIIEMTEDLPPIQGDRVRLNQILNNLVANAVKFTDEGSITLRAFRQDGELCIAVEDTGVGIEKEQQQAIFEQFRQADGSFKRRAEGTGLGLAITRHLVQMHGGIIEVHSQVGEGSTFIVRLPVKGPVVEQTPASGNGQKLPV